MEFICPKPEALTPMPAQDCPFRLDQIVRMAFARRAMPPFVSETTMKLLATWTPLIAASDETKVVISPLFAGFVVPSSEGIFQGGGDNTTFNGLRIYQGENFVTVTGQFSNISPAVHLALTELSQYSLASSVGVTDLGIIPFNKNGYAFPNALDTIPVYNFRVATRGSEGLNANDIIPFSFDVLPEWDKHLQSVKLSFDPLTAF